jgi:thymidylate synthase
MKNNTDLVYKDLLQNILINGTELSTRNSEVTSYHDLPNTTFWKFPLITFRKTAWKKAIKEMEWFISGKTECPKELLDWWNGQLDEEGHLCFGYSHQLRHFTTDELFQPGNIHGFDQIKFFLDGLKNSPNSRRLVATVWHPEEMANITDYNCNPNTPTCCHSIVIQLFVREGQLHMKTYQRSADMLLGVPHNWVQSWALLLYLAYHSNLKVGSMTWMWGDAHIYKEESHMETVKEIFSVPDNNATSNVELVYEPKDVIFDGNGVPVFDASDFYIVGEIPEPSVKTRPKLL